MSRSRVHKARASICTGVAASLFAVVVSAGPARAGTLPDAWITTKAKIALIASSHVGHNDVHVDTNGGRITLYGKTTSKIERDHAGETVKGIRGVSQVRNLLQVVPASAQETVNQDDGQIKKDVAQCLKNAGSDGVGISVRSVDRGVVLLAGKATNLSSVLFVVQAASLVPGVRRVVTEIKSPDQVASLDFGKIPAETEHLARDAWITTATKLRLIADGDVPALDISVDTCDGVVTLFGSVPTSAAHASAIADAQKVDPSVKVHDELQVVPAAESAKLGADDGAVKTAVQKALKKRAEWKHVAVAVQGGVVHLTGSVASGWMRLDAAFTARAAPGVRSVEDDLHIDSDGARR